MDAKEIRKLVALMKEMSLAEIEIETSGQRIRLRMDTSATHLPTAPSTHGVQRPALPEHVVDNTAIGTIIRSPMVGVFYRSSSPTADPYVQIGDSVKKDQTLCIIEAMKLMNEIESELEGKVVEIYPDNGTAVEYGTPLFRIEPQ